MSCGSKYLIIVSELGNQTNHDRHLKSDRSGRSDLLHRMLIGNILSMAKGLGYVVASQMRLDIGRTQHKSCMVKGVGMLGITGEFMVNFAIPEYLGLGKSFPQLL